MELSVMATEPEKSWWVYIIECGDGSLYCGVSNDVGRRVRDHAGPRGARYVRAHGGVSKLLWTCPAPSRGIAQRMEAWVKGLRRDAKLAMITGERHISFDMFAAEPEKPCGEGESKLPAAGMR